MALWFVWIVIVKGPVIAYRHYRHSINYGLVGSVNPYQHHYKEDDEHHQRYKRVYTYVIYRS